MARRHDLEILVVQRCSSRRLGTAVEWHDTLTSTNERARTLAMAGATEGSIVVADHQTEGRGCMGRSWHSPAGGGLWFSIILHPSASPLLTPRLTTLAAQAVQDVLHRVLGISSQLKHPNDILVGGRKICGILAESSMAAGSTRVDYVIIGVGLNLTTTFDPPLCETATAVANHTDGPVPSPENLLPSILSAIEERYKP